MKRFLTLAFLLLWSLPASAQLLTTGAGKGTPGGGASGWCNLIPQSGLVNCWPFDTANTTSGTATDVVGGKNSTQTNISLNGSGPSSNLNNSIACNGTTSRGDTTLANIPLSAFSVVAWLKPTATTGNGRYMANDHTDADNKGFQFIQNTAATIYIGNGTSASNTNTGASTITAGSWQMVTFTYDGTNMKTFINTTAGGTNTLTGPVASGTNNVSFCVNPAYSGDFYNGSLAGVAVYSRAISSGEVTTINGL